MRYVITVEGETFEIDVGREGRVWVNDRPYDVDFQGLDGRPECSLLVDHRSYEAHVEHAALEETRPTVRIPHARDGVRAAAYQGRVTVPRGVHQASAKRRPWSRPSDAPCPSFVVW